MPPLAYSPTPEELVPNILPSLAVRRRSLEWRPLQSGGVEIEGTETAGLKVDVDWHPFWKHTN